MFRLVFFLGLLVALGGCGSSDAESLCDGPNDPTGLFCEPDIATFDLLTAETRARQEVGEEGVLVIARGSQTRLLDPDGYASDWTFGYFFPDREGSDRSVLIQVFETTTFSQEGSIPTLCEPEKPLTPFDSRVVVPDAVRRLEATDNPVRLGEFGVLDLRQVHPCFDSFDNRKEAVIYSGAAGSSVLLYSDTGEFLDLIEEEL
ncbi:MAG: hypothetical protein AAGF92_19980 [Myxococcota bacterium]